MFHDLETVEGFGECPPHVRCKKCGRVAMAPDEFGSDCATVIQFAQKTLAQRMEERQRVDATILKRLDEKKTMEIQNVEKLEWKVENDTYNNFFCVDEPCKRVTLTRNGKNLGSERIVPGLFRSVASLIAKAKKRLLANYYLNEAESGPVYVPYQPRK